MDFLYPLAFWVLAAVIAVSAIAVVVSQNIVRAATWLLFTLGGVAGIFFLLGADFVGATQLLVYVGGTLVLVVFGVMLTAQGPFINLRIAAGEWAIAATVGIAFFSMLAYAVMTIDLKLPDAKAEATAKGDETAAEPEGASASGKRSLSPSIVLGLALLGFEQTAPDAPITGLRNVPSPRSAGVVLPGNPEKQPEVKHKAEMPVRYRTKMSYLLPFEIVSVHLLVVLIGAAYLARSKRRRGATA
jgi:NADH:ubiquinone oxidoreductase subunit 6 (subunit J)